MMSPIYEKQENVVPFETALDQAGFGCYSYLLTALCGLVIISFSVIAYSIAITIPASACELNTTSAQQGFIAAAPSVGAIIGTLVWGYLADTRGRRKMLLVSLFLGTVVNILASLSVNWIMLIFMKFLATVMVSGQYPISMTLLSESVPKDKRNFVVLLVTSVFLLAQGVMAGMAIPVIPLTFSYPLPSLGIYWNSWRTLMVVYSIPSVISLSCMYFIKESPKFTLVKNNEEEEAIEILKTIHRINNKRGAIFEVSGLILPEEDRNNSISPKKQIGPLFQMPLLKPVIILTTLLVFQLNGPFIIWLPRIANQFVNTLLTGDGSNRTLCGVIDISLNAPADPNAVPCALNVTALLLVLIVGAMQSTTNFLVSLVLDKVGRRNMVMIVTFTCGLSGILVNLVPNAIASGVLFVINLIGQITLGLYTAIAVSIFPTQLRAIAIAFAITADRICSFASIQILNFLLENYCEVGFYVYSCIFASSALVASLLPDDRVVKPKTRSASKRNSGSTHL